MADVIRALTTPDVAAIRAASAKYVATALAQDRDSWMSLSAGDAVFMPPHAEALETRAKLQAWFDALPKMSTFRLTQLEIDGRADLAYVRGRYEYATDAGSDSGKYVEIWKKHEDGSWKISRDIWNSDASA